MQDRKASIVFDDLLLTPSYEIVDVDREIASREPLYERPRELNHRYSSGIMIVAESAIVQDECTVDPNLFVTRAVSKRSDDVQRVFVPLAVISGVESNAVVYVGEKGIRFAGTGVVVTRKLRSQILSSRRTIRQVANAHSVAHYSGRAPGMKHFIPEPPRFAHVGSVPRDVLYQYRK